MESLFINFSGLKSKTTNNGSISSASLALHDVPKYFIMGSVEFAYVFIRRENLLKRKENRGTFILHFKSSALSGYQVHFVSPTSKKSTFAENGTFWV